VKPVDCVRIVHWMRNALAHVQKGQHTMVAAAIRQAFLQTDAAAAHQTWRHVADQLRPRWPKLAALMDDSEHDVLAYMAFPGQHRTKLHSTNPLERLNKEVKRRARACPGEGRGCRHLPERGQYHPADRRRAARTE
jgi:transposase-like protein